MGFCCTSRTIIVELEGITELAVLVGRISLSPKIFGEFLLHIGRMFGYSGTTFSLARSSANLSHGRGCQEVAGEEIQFEMRPVKRNIWNMR